MAWTQTDETFSDRMFVDRLDAAAHVTGSVNEIPLFSNERVDVASISMAKSATRPGFVLSWVEIGTSSRAVFCRLTPDLNPSAP